MARLRELTVFPERGHFTTFTSLAGVRRRFEYYWREGTQSWYLDIREADDTPIVTGAKVVAGGQPLRGKGLNFPEQVVVFFEGKDYNDPLALGDTIKVYVID